MRADRSWPAGAPPLLKQVCTRESTCKFLLLLVFLGVALHRNFLSSILGLSLADACVKQPKTEAQWPAYSKEISDVPSASDSA